MDFFAKQEQARRATSWLLLLFVAALVCIFGAVYGAVSVGVATYESLAVVPGAFEWFSLERAVITLSIALVVVGVSALLKHAELRRGGAAVAVSLGATPVDVSTRRRLERRLVNVVEEMAVAAGTPVPLVFVLEREQGINAFAAGYELSDAAITVTQGALENLNRDELQAIIAHEFSHILNGDMRLNTRLVSVLHGILTLTIAARLLRGAISRSSADGGNSQGDSSPRSSRSRISFSSFRSNSGSSSSSRSDSSRGSSAGAAVALLIAIVVTIVLVTLVGAVGSFFARWIQAIICRKRELLADAVAVQLTRNEAQVRRALRRVEGDSVGALLMSPNASSVAHMFFAEGVRGWLPSHPPLGERIEQLGGVSPKSEPLPRVQNPSGQVFVPPQRLLSVVGSMKLEDLEYAAGMLAALPDGLRDALADPVMAEALTYLMLLQPDPNARQEQWLSVESTLDGEVIAAMHELGPALVGLEPRHRLPLLELALPSLRTMASQARARLLSNIDQLIDSDGKTELFEFVLRCLVQARLTHASPLARSTAKRAACRQAARVVLTVMARLEIADPETRARLVRESSFDAGYDPPLEIELEEGSDWVAFRSALDVLHRARPRAQRRFLDACERLMLADGKLSLAECELFRAIVVSVGAALPARAVQRQPDVGEAARAL
ncbi:MAG TPA: M48 family metalloprotease [Polyangiaceae bacterium]|nr:M48 family metalloprotease [Polyangiaceae bacterium]